MKSLKNIQYINDCIDILPTFQTQLNTITQYMEEYLELTKDEKKNKLFQNQQQTKEEILHQKENEFIKISEIIEKRKSLQTNGNEIVELLDELKKRIETMSEDCIEDENILITENNEMIDKIIEIRKEIMEETVSIHYQKIKQYRSEFIQKKTELLKNKLEKKHTFTTPLQSPFPFQTDEYENFQDENDSPQYNEYNSTNINTTGNNTLKKSKEMKDNNNNTLNIIKNNQLKKSIENLQNLQMIQSYCQNEENNTLIKQNENSVFFNENNSNTSTQSMKSNNEKMNEINVKLEQYFLTQSECQQIEQWTNKKCSTLLFDSNKDNWNIKTSIFDDRIKGKYNLLIVIEDDQNNKFGGYITQPIQQNTWTSDKQAFLFSLKSNGRIKKQMKFEIKENVSKYAFYLGGKEESWLFQFSCNHDIRICKQNSDGVSCCCQNNNYYDYHGTSNAFIPNCFNKDQQFNPKRFVVIEMN